MKAVFKNHAASVLGILALFAASPAYALTINSVQDINDKILCKIFAWMFTFLIVISAIMGLVGAYFFMTSGGDSEKVDKAKKTLIYAVIGVMVALVAKAFPGLISSIFGGGAVSTC